MSRQSILFRQAGMPKILRLLGCVLVAAVAVAAVGPAVAQAQRAPAQAAAPAGKVPPASIAVIDIQRIMRDASAHKGARQQLEQFRNTFQAEMAKEDEKLRGEDQELMRQRSILAPEVWDQRRQAFQSKVIEVQRRVQERSQAVDKSMAGVREQIAQQVVKILEELSAERGFNMVLDRSQMHVIIGDNIDLTVEVLRRLDQRLPSVKVNLPAAQ